MKMFTFALLGAAMLSATTAGAQGTLPLSFEARGEFAFPTGDFAEDDVVENGVGFNVNAMFNVLPILGIYGGFERHSFALSDDGSEFGEVDADIIDSGFSVGAQLSLPLGMTGLRPWVKGGAIFHTMELDASAEELGGDFAFESDRSTGFEVGGGFDIPLGQVLSFTPGVMYRSYSPQFEDFEGEDGENVSHVSVGVGFRFRL